MLSHLSVSKLRSLVAKRKSGHRRSNRTHRRRPLFEQLEFRRVLATYVVDALDDEIDGDTSDGICATEGPDVRCTLRAAIQQANATPDADEIILPEGTITLTLSNVGGGSDDSEGDLDITAPVRIIGQGMTATTILAENGDRVFEIGSGEVEIRGTTIRNGNTAGFGGGILIQPAFGTVSLTDVVIEGNTATSGGGIYNAGTLVLQNAIIRNHNLQTVLRSTGAGLYNTNTARATLGRVQILDNAAEADGGAIYNQGSTGPEPGGIVFLLDSVLQGNFANERGGGVFNGSEADLDISTSTIETNGAGLNGGGIFNDTNGLVFVAISTLSGNSAGGGAGIYNLGNVDLRSVTIAQNMDSNAIAEGVGLFNDGPSAEATATHTIFADNVGGNCSGNLVTSLDYNLDSDGTCSLDGDNDISNVNAQLETLSDNGGVGRTHALARTSPAVDAGDPQACLNGLGNPTTDQRGFPRPVDGNNDQIVVCDIGAFELEPVPTGSISGRKYNDQTGDGITPDDTGLANVRIDLLRDNGDGVLNAEDVLQDFALTDADGDFSFSFLEAGTYFVREDLTGLDAVQTAGGDPGQDYYTINLDDGVSVLGASFANFLLIDISGQKFHDLDGDGVNDGDDGLAGTIIFLDADGDDVFDSGEISTTTADDGTFRFENLGPGTYRVREVVPDGWIQTTAQPDPITAISGADVENIDFGNFNTTTISGLKFNDLNGDGIRDSQEPGLPGFTIFLDQNGDGVLDAGEPSTVTGADGSYTFTDLGPGTYQVREVVPDGWIQTTAQPDPITAISGADVENIDFGNFNTTTISGLKFNDLNGDGIRDSQEPGLPGFTIFLDQNGDGVLDAGEPSTVTGADGSYTFTDLGPGTYLVREVVSDGWIQTTAQPDPITAISGVDVENIDFGNFNTTTISGLKFNDLNGDGIRDSQEPGLPGFTVFLDLNGDGVLDAGEPNTVTSGDGSYTFTDLGPGTYLVREVVPDDWIQTTAQPVPITAISGVDVANIDFGNFRTATISGLKFNDLDGDGIRDSQEPGLPGFTIFLDQNGDGVLNAGEPSTVTNADGSYSFSDLDPGTYQVREVVPAGWIQTTAQHAPIVIVSGDEITNVDFGNFRTFTISGTKFDDLDADGIRDAAEQGIANVTIFIDLNSDGILNAGEPSTETDVNGNYVFANLEPGTYRIREVLPPGSRATTAPPSDIVGVSGGDVSGIDFGNVSLGNISGRKFEDLDGNGEFDTGETGLDGWTIVLVDRATGAVVATAITAGVDENGNGTIEPAERGHYSFSNVPFGQYEVQEVPQLGWEAVYPRPRFVLTTAVRGVIATTGSEAVDLDGDGDIDLVAIDDLSGDLLILANDGDGGFSVARTVNVAVRPQSIAVGDLNGDQLPDLVIASVGTPQSRAGNSNAVVALINTGNLSFTSRSIQAGDGPIAVAMGDLNGDGSLDVVVANFRSDNLSLLINDGAGNLSAAQHLHMAEQPVALATGDIDGDGDIDIVGATFLAGRVVPWLNQGNGTFMAATPLEAGDGTSAVELVDLNGDSRLDIVAANHLSDDLSIFMNDGSSFLPAVQIPVGARPKAISHGDLDQDGIVDLAIANSGDDTVTILFGNDFGSPSIPFRFAAGRGPESVNIADFDGDGDEDLAVANYIGNGMSILINAPGFYIITVESGSDRIDGVDFGNRRSATTSPPDINFAFHNSQQPNDVNADGSVSPLDALSIINDLNSNGARMLLAGEGEASNVAATRARHFVDTNRDNRVTPADVLRVINFLNSATGGEGESDPPSLPVNFDPMLIEVAVSVHSNSSNRSPLRSSNLLTAQSFPGLPVPTARSSTISANPVNPSRNSSSADNLFETLLTAIAEDIASAKDGLGESRDDHDESDCSTVV